MPQVKYQGPAARVVIDGIEIEQGGPAVEVSDAQLARLDDGRRQIEVLQPQGKQRKPKQQEGAD